VVTKSYGAAEESLITGDLDASSDYVVRNIGTDKTYNGTNHLAAADILQDAVSVNGVLKASLTNTDSLAAGHVIKTHASDTVTVTKHASLTASTYAKVRTDDNAFVKGESYVIRSLGTNGSAVTGDNDGTHIKAAASGTLSSATALTVGLKFTIDADATDLEMARVNSLIQGMTFTKASDTLTQDIEAVQAKINTARVQAGSQYAALESAVDYTTDLTAQYELGFNTVNDVNFSMETAHLAKKPNLTTSSDSNAGTSKPRTAGSSPADPGLR